MNLEIKSLCYVMSKQYYYNTYQDAEFKNNLTQQYENLYIEVSLVSQIHLEDRPTPCLAWPFW